MGTRPRSKTITKAERKPVRSAWPPDDQRVQAILHGLDQLYPAAECELRHSNPFQLLCSTILSAQCTDERVNQVTKSLFKKYKKPEDYLKVSNEELEKDIFS